MKNQLILALLLSVFSLSISAQSTDSNEKNKLISSAVNAFGNKKYDAALDYYLKAGRMCSKTGSELRTYVRTQIGAARCYEAMDSCRNAYNTVRQLLNLKLNDTEKHDASVILYDNGMELAVDITNEDLNNFADARAVYEEIKPYVEGERLQKVKVRLQGNYIVEAKLKIDKLNFSDAMECFKKSYYISDDTAQRIEILNDIALLTENTGDVDLVLKCYNEIRRLCKIVDDDYHHYQAIKKQRNIYQSLNDMEQFTKLGMSLDSLMANNKNPKILGDYYDYIGNEFVRLGNYDVAEAYFSRYPELIDKVNSKSEKLMLQTKYYGSMRDLKRKQNDYIHAIDYSSKLAECYSLMYDNTNFVRYAVYLVDTQLYAEINDSLNFERYSDSLRYAYNHISDAFNKSLVYNFIGMGYSKLGNGEKAIDHYYKADSLLAEKYDETFDLRMIMTELRAGELKKIGRTAEACRLYKHYMELVAKVYGKKSQQYSKAVYEYANSLRADGRNEDNAALYSKSIDILENILRAQLRYVPSTDRQFFISTFSDRLWTMLSFALVYKDEAPDFVKRCYNTTIMLKSLLFESDRSMYNTLQLKGTKEDVEDFVKMSSLRMKRKSLFRNYAANKEVIDSLGLQIRNLDNKLTEKSKLYSEYTSFLNFKYEDICKSMRKDDVLFDFFDFNTREGEHKYVAYVVRKDFKNPEIIEMFDENSIDSLLDGSDIDILYKEDMSESALNLFWHKLEKYVRKGSKVYYVPSGLMYQVSLESIPLADGSLLGEHYDFIRLTSAQRITDTEAVPEGNKKAVLYGGLKYDLDIADMKEASMKFQNSNLYSMRSMAHGQSKFSYLPETLRETEKISDILKNNGYDVVTYTEGEGTEETFLSMHNNSPQLLHLATHGFYYTPEEAHHNSFLKGTTDAMFLSGLVLSGGNAAWQGKTLPQGVLGGIISAGNISCLDLSNINLAVLSACQSGQGKVTREGLFGLQRAFKKAGVHTMVMTLWNVSDRVTSDFMIEFYKNLFKKKVGRRDKKKAFMKAKQTIRKKYPEPHYWAGFVMVD